MFAIATLSELRDTEHFRCDFILPKQEAWQHLGVVQMIHFSYCAVRRSLNPRRDSFVLFSTFPIILISNHKPSKPDENLSNVVVQHERFSEQSVPLNIISVSP